MLRGPARGDNPKYGERPVGDILIKQETTMAKKVVQDTEVVSDPRNARLHPDDNKAMIRRSLEEVGAGRSILIDGDNIVRAGNGVFEQAVELGLDIKIVDVEPDQLIAVRRKDLQGEAAVRAALYDNAASDRSKFDAVVIQDMLERERHLLDGILTDQDLNRILLDTQKGTDVIDLGYDNEGSGGFSEGEQFKNGENYEVIIDVPAALANDAHFKEALRFFCAGYNLGYKLRLA